MYLFYLHMFSRHFETVDNDMHVSVFVSMYILDRWRCMETIVQNHTSRHQLKFIYRKYDRDDDNDDDDDDDDDDNAYL